MKKIFYLITILFATSTANALDVTIENPKIRLMPPGAPMTAGYFVITNNTENDITLVGVSSSKYNSIEIHDTVKEGDVMKMVKQDAVTISANSKFEFKPMSYHLMFMMPKENLKENQKVDVTFYTKSGETFSANFLLQKMQPMKMEHMNMGSMKYMMRPDYVFPAGVKGGKNMMSKKIMFGYKFGTMDMDCCGTGTSDASNNFIQAAGYTMAPIDMSMDMHMFSAMYAVNNKFSVMAMLPYIEKEMEMEMLTGMMAGRYNTTSSRGVGDLSIAGLYKISDKSNFKLALSIPTGEFDEKDHNLSGTLVTLPYPMQLGSGTYDIALGYSYHNILDDWSYGFQLNALKRIDYNSEGWKYGDRREVSAWVAKPVSKLVSLSFGLDIEHQENINGKSANRNNMTPTWSEYNHSYLRVSSNVGLNYKIPKLKSRIGIQCGTPIYNDANGIQMEPEFKCNLGFSKMM